MASSSSPSTTQFYAKDIDRLVAGQYRGGSSTSPSLSSSRQSRRDLLRSQNPPPHHVSKLEDVLKSGKSRKSRKTSKDRVKGAGKTSDDEREDDEAPHLTTDVGILREEVYDEYLPAPIAWIRRWLVWSLKKESRFIAWHQTKVRTHVSDLYFVYTSLMGSHSFFLIFLPMTFWVFNRHFGRGLVNVLAFGVYLSSAVKDLFCVPRPFSPPVTRLTVGSTHLEFGFPSTHSTNSVGTALYVYLWVSELRKSGSSPAVLDSILWELGLGFYVFSVVYGRIYAGMHSFVDCFAGSVLGASITFAQWYLAEHLERFLEIPGWTVPAILIPATLFAVHFHPQPLDDCPCFEDAIAFISVVMGVSLGRWICVRYPEALGMPDREVPLNDPLRLQRLEAAGVGSPSDAIISILRALGALVCGVAMVFCVRVVVKTACKLSLPTIFRYADRTFGLVLPRRHYMPSSEYEQVPLDNIIRPPSVLNLPDKLAPGLSAKSDNVRGGTSSSGSLDPSRAHDIRRILRDSSGHLSIASSSDGDVSSRSNSPLSFSSDDKSSHQGSLPRTAKRQDSMHSLGQAFSPASSSSTKNTSDATHLEEFPPPPASKLSVPFTHPFVPDVGNSASGSGSGNAHLLPGDDLVNKFAASMSEDERRRQLARDAGQVKHYDVDVLTKFLVYGNIGFWTASLIPAVLNRLGLI